MRKQVKLFILGFVFLGTVRCYSAEVLWNTFNVWDFSSWENGAWLLDAPLPFGPGIGFYVDGSVWLDSFNAAGGGSYWVHSYYGDELASFEEYAKRPLLADVNYTCDQVLVGTHGLSGHEYLAIIGFTSDEYDPRVIPTTYYGWVELDGKKVIGSALTADGPLRVGTGELLPEPTAAVLLVLGTAVLGLRRKKPRKTAHLRGLSPPSSNLPRLQPSRAGDLNFLPFPLNPSLKPLPGSRQKMLKSTACLWSD